MLPLDPDDYPRVMRDALQRIRKINRQVNAEISFEDAWRLAQKQYPPPKPWCSWPPMKGGRTSDDGLTKFLYQHFHSAWLDDDSPRGRMRLSAPESCEGGTAVPLATVSHGAGRCRSGSGCDLKAECGTFGPTFCRDHWEELRAMASSTLEGHDDDFSLMAA